MKLGRTLYLGRISAMIVVIAVALASLGLATPTSARVRQADPNDPLVFAHYYIWFEPSSWNRAKSDFPALGRYSSDDASVMREHVELAKSVGIDGFIVSWKSSEVLDPRLEKLVAIAEELQFKLAITYQALDFNRDPLPPARIGEDLDHFVERFASSPVFDAFGLPLVVWTGTEKFAAEDIALVTSQRKGKLLILASEKSVEGYQRIGDVVDGNLYYWSSVNPETFPEYPAKLIQMANTVRAYGGIWIAPAAPGFDTELLGGSTIVDRNEGQTLRDQWQGAAASLPDAIGVISWNEFSENTHIEPSIRYGTDALNVVADLRSAPRPSAIDFDSSAPGGAPETSSGIMRIVALATFGLVMVGSMVVVRRRSPKQDTMIRSKVGR